MELLLWDTQNAFVDKRPTLPLVSKHVCELHPKEGDASLLHARNSFKDVLFKLLLRVLGIIELYFT